MAADAGIEGVKMPITLTDPITVFIGKERDGCIVAAAVDHPDVRVDLADWIRMGLTVERVPGPVAVAPCIHVPAVKPNG